MSDEAEKEPPHAPLLQPEVLEDDMSELSLDGTHTPPDSLETLSMTVTEIKALEKRTEELLLPKH